LCPETPERRYDQPILVQAAHRIGCIDAEYTTTWALRLRRYLVDRLDRSCYQIAARSLVYKLPNYPIADLN
jgi:hypothetical protein